MKIEFENSMRRLNFLCSLMDIKIAWINPCVNIQENIAKQEKSERRGNLAYLQQSPHMLCRQRHQPRTPYTSTVLTPPHLPPLYLSWGSCQNWLYRGDEKNCFKNRRGEGGMIIRDSRVFRGNKYPLIMSWM